MSNRSSTSPRPQSPSQSLPINHQSSASLPRHTVTAPSMIQVARPSLAPSSSFGFASSQYPSHVSHYIPPSPPYPTQTFSPPAVVHQSTPPPDIMRTFERGRGVKRRRSEDKSADEDERQASPSGSETDGNQDQPVLPAPKKRTRTLMTPDQLTALHRLLAMTRFPTTEQREQCGREIGLSARRVQTPPQNQRQKSKAQQQAASQAGSSRGHALASRSSGPYQVFSYDSLRYDPPVRPYTSPYPYPVQEYYHAHPVAPPPRRSSRLGHHRRDSSSLSYPAPPTSAPHDQLPRSYLPASYAMDEVEFSHSPVSRYEQRSPEPGGSHSPEVSTCAERDDTLPPLWPENSLEASHGEMDASSPSTSLRRGPSRPALLPTGLPPPQPLEPTPLWSHPHTNPRYMRPLPPASGLPSLLGGLSRGRARSDPPVGSFSSSSQAPSQSMGLGLGLTGIPPTQNTERLQDVAPSPERTSSDPIGLRPRRRTPSRSETALPAHEEMHPQPESPRPRTARGGATHSRRSSRDSVSR
ncbi:homeobox domain protein [Ceratobasidium sp. AG-Ba]|nr:homeobox domain protein [Ceratobasidium sp. AG-Ba]